MRMANSDWTLYALGLQFKLASKFRIMINRSNKSTWLNSPLCNSSVFFFGQSTRNCRGLFKLKSLTQIKQNLLVSFDCITVECWLLYLLALCHRQGSINGTLLLNLSSTDNRTSDQLIVIVLGALQNDTSFGGQLAQAVDADVLITELTCIAGCQTTVEQSK